MATEIKVPTLGESVSEATVAKWFKAVGDPIAVDEPLVELFLCGRLHANNMGQIAMSAVFVVVQRTFNMEPSIDSVCESWSLDTRFDHVVGQEFRGSLELHFLVSNPVNTSANFPV